MNLYGFAGGDPVNFDDPFGLFDCDKKTGDGCSDEYKRLLKVDKPLEAPLVDPVAIGSGMLAGALLAPAEATAVSVGTKVYRVFGGEAKQMGRSWTMVNPSSVANYAAEAGLPEQNAATHMVQGTIKNMRGVKVTTAAPGAKGPGGIIEVVIPDPATQVKVMKVGPFIPK